MKQQKILLIGGPATGKSSVIAYLENKGFRCMREISREVIREAQENGIEQLFLTDPLLFSQKLLEKRIKQFQSAEKLLESTIFIDRGIPDVTAYLDYIGNVYPKDFTLANKLHRYDKVFILPIWKEIYTADQERYETLEEAIKIQKQLIATYQTLGYDLISVPRTSIAKRALFVLENLGLTL